MARELPEKSTPIVNEILEKLALAKLAVYEYKVLIAVIRKTYGWNKKTDWISGSQLELATGIPRHHCHRTVTRLVQKNILTRDGKSIGINKRVEQWDCENTTKKVPLEGLPQEVLVPEQVVPPEVLNSTSRGTKIVPPEVHTKEKKETITKDSIVANEKKHEIEGQEFSSDAMTLSEGLLKCILHNNEKFKHTKETTKKWAQEIDRMLRIDSRTFDEVKAVIRFAQTDQFWKTNILSAKKLREKFDTLWMQSQRKPGSKPQKKIFFTTKNPTQ